MRSAPAEEIELPSPDTLLLLFVEYLEITFIFCFFLLDKDQDNM